MAQPYIGDIRMFGFGFAPRNYAQCNGQLMAISQNQALFAILGTTYGGNGVQTFALPNLQSRIAVHWGTSQNWSVNLGQVGGEEFHTLLQSEIPQHFHSITVSNAAATSPLPTNNLLAQPPTANLYASPDNGGALNPASLGTYGSSLGHENRQPFTVINFCICLFGVFPSRN